MSVENFEILEKLSDLTEAMNDVRCTLMRIEREMEPLRKLVMSHGERITRIEHDSLTPLPKDA